MYSSTALPNASTAFIIWGICIGVTLGFIFNFVSKAIPGPFIRALFSKDAIGEDKAVSLRDIGFLNKKLTLRALRDGSPLRNMVSVVGGKLPTITANKKTAIDYEKALFYIPESKKSKAYAAYGEKERWYVLPLFIILAVAIAYGMTQIMPLLVDALFY